MRFLALGYFSNSVARRRLDEVFCGALGRYRQKHTDTQTHIHPHTHKQAKDGNTTTWRRLSLKRDVFFFATRYLCVIPLLESVGLHAAVGDLRAFWQKKRIPLSPTVTCRTTQVVAYGVKKHPHLSAGDKKACTCIPKHRLRSAPVPTLKSRQQLTTYRGGGDASNSESNWQTIKHAIGNPHREFLNSPLGLTPGLFHPGI